MDASSIASDSLPISALQHYVFCPRQFALIHIERLWAENIFTAKGRVMHTRSDSGERSVRRGIKTETHVQLSSQALRIHGVADVIESLETEAGVIYTPVEYKRGKPKPHRADEVQLCAQAMCIEEMRRTAISQAALYYGQPRRRYLIDIDENLRQLTQTAIDGCWSLINTLSTPSANYQKQRCDRCSLNLICNPKALGKARSAQDWFERRLISL